MLLSNLNLLAQAPNGVARLRELILTLAVQGKLVPQDPSDEPASQLLQKIRAEKDRLIAEGKIRRDKPLEEIAEDEKPFGLPKGWEWPNLATVGVINPRNDATDETIASFVEMRSIPVAFSAEHVAESRPWRDIKSGFTQFAEGDVGVAKITPCFENGKSTVFQNLSNGIGAGTTELHIVRPLGGIAPKYVLLFLKTPAFLLNGEAVMTGSAGQKRMPRDYFERTPFPLPPLAEQSRIVTRVEELMRLCDALEAKGQLEATQQAQLVSTLLATLTESETPAQLADNWHRIATHFDLLLDRPEAVDALEQTIFGLAMRGMLVPQDLSDEPAAEVVKRIAERRKQTRMKSVAGDSDDADTGSFSLPQSWAWCKVEQIATVCLGGTPARQEPSYWNGTISWVSSGEVANGRISDTKETITPAGLANSNAKVYPRNTVLIAMIGQGKTRGQSAILDIEACTNQNVAGLILEQEAADPDFIFLWALHEYVRTRSGGRGGAQPALNGAIVRSLKVPLPPLAEQFRIVTRVAQLRRLCADLRQRLAASQSTQAHLAEALVQEVA